MVVKNVPLLADDHVEALSVLPRPHSPPALSKYDNIHISKNKLCALRNGFKKNKTTVMLVYHFVPGLRGSEAQPDTVCTAGAGINTVSGKELRISHHTPHNSST